MATTTATGEQFVTVKVPPQIKATLSLLKEFHAFWETFDELSDKDFDWLSDFQYGLMEFLNHQIKLMNSAERRSSDGRTDPGTDDNLNG